VYVVAVGNFRQMTRYTSKTSTVANVVHLVRSQIRHTERPPFFSARLPFTGSSATADTCLFSLLTSGTSVTNEICLRYKHNLEPCQEVTTNNKCSAVAEMGDRLATIDTGRKLGAGVVPLLGELGPHLIQCGLGRGLPSYQVAS